MQRLSREKWAAEASPSCRGKSCRNPGLYPGKPEASAHLTDIPCVEGGTSCHGRERGTG